VVTLAMSGLVRLVDRGRGADVGTGIRILSRPYTASNCPQNQGHCALAAGTLHMSS
jgi:hypothetical protein